jgi:hypothetical protein
VKRDDERGSFGTAMAKGRSGHRFSKAQQTALKGISKTPK